MTENFSNGARVDAEPGGVTTSSTHGPAFSDEGEVLRWANGG